MKTAYVVISTLFAASSFAAPAVKAPEATPALIEKGKAVYTTNCTTCHGDTGDGMGPAGQFMNPKPRHFVKDKFKKGDKVEQIFQSITKGLDGTSMTSYAYLSDEDRWALAHYVVKLRKKK